MMDGGLRGFKGCLPVQEELWVIPHPYSSEQVYISSFAFLKMLKHGRAGVSLEVMALMLGEFVDEYIVRPHTLHCSHCKCGSAITVVLTVDEI